MRSLAWFRVQRVWAFCHYVNEVMPISQCSKIFHTPSVIPPKPSMAGGCVATMSVRPRETFPTVVEVSSVFVCTTAASCLFVFTPIAAMIGCEACIRFGVVES